MNDINKVVEALEELAENVFHKDIREGVELSIDVIKEEFGIATEDAAPCEYTPVELERIEDRLSNMGYISTR